MDRGLIDSFEIKSKSAFRNLKFAILLCAMVFGPCFPSEAQQPGKVPRIGYLGSVSSSPRVATFRQGLRELGYVEGKNIIIEWQHHEGKVDRLPTLAAELL
jgi:putative ABC transport system substrate-binding protein